VNRQGRSYILLHSALSFFCRERVRESVKGKMVHTQQQKKKSKCRFYFFHTSLYTQPTYKQSIKQSINQPKQTMALVERTNSSELYEMRLPYTTDSPDRRLRSGSKKQQQQQQQQQKSILRETARSGASSPSLSLSSSFSSDDDDDAATATSLISLQSTTSTSHHSRRSVVSFVEDDISETRIYDTTAPPAAAAKTVVVHSSCFLPIHTAAATTTSTITASLYCKQQQQQPPKWMGDNTLSNTDVFHKRLNRPAAMIQARVRGMLDRRRVRQARILRLQQELLALECYAASLIQAQVRGRKQRKHYTLCRAAIPMQAAFRGWVCRLQLRVKKLQRRLEAVAARHARELREIEDDKQREMQRMDKDLHAVDAKLQKRQSNQKVDIDRVIEELRADNSKLRSQNETLGQASVIMAQKNERLWQQTLVFQQNVREVEKNMPQLQADHEHISRVHRECKTVVQQYETALQQSQENLLGEKKISDLFRVGIEAMLQRIEVNGSVAGNNHEKSHHDFAGSQSNEKLAETLRKSCSRRIRMALKEQEKANQLARGEKIEAAVPASSSAPSSTTSSRSSSSSS
jgi:IQ calmodulin-binding motif